jgi:hypothetical protein
VKNEYFHAPMNDQHPSRRLLAICKRLLPTFIFYGVAVAALEVMGKISPGGPCAPGLGILFFFLLIPVVIGLLIYNIYLTVNRGKNNGIIALVHAAVLVFIFVVLNVG